MNNVEEKVFELGLKNPVQPTFIPSFAFVRARHSIFFGKDAVI
jgi:hypothetical protein